MPPGVTASIFDFASQRERLHLRLRLRFGVRLRLRLALFRIPNKPVCDSSFENYFDLSTSLTFLQISNIKKRFKRTF